MSVSVCAFDPRQVGSALADAFANAEGISLRLLLTGSADGSFACFDWKGAAYGDDPHGRHLLLILCSIVTDTLQCCY